jgi:hypothetical protein
LFPKCSLSFSQAKRVAEQLNERLVELAVRRKIPTLPVSDEWFGFDPIHIKRSIQRSAWPAILSAWGSGVAPAIAPRVSFRRWVYLHRLAPFERTFFGRVQRCDQPSGVLDDGTTISLY